MATNQTNKLKKTANLLREAIPRMSQLDIPLTPENYHVWYQYTMGGNAELERAIDELLASGAKFNTRINNELYSTFIQKPAEEQVKLFQREVHKLIQKLFERIRSTNESTENLSGSLEKYQQVLQNEPDMETVTSLIADLIDETTHVLTSNREMESALQSLNTEIDTLKENLQSLTATVYTDELTGIFNRRALEKRMDELLDTHEEEGTVFSLLMVDIDHFKQFNDKYGHTVGDKVLRYVAHILKGGIKGDDMVARYGGEEFAILLPATDYDGAMAVGDHVRSKVAGRHLVNGIEEKQSVGNVTVSVGAAAFRAADDADSLIARADQALYLAKNSGRNRVRGERDLPD